MSYRLLGSLFAAVLLAACAQTDAPDPNGEASAEAPPPAMPETEAMAEEKASMEEAMGEEHGHDDHCVENGHEDDVVPGDEEQASEQIGHEVRRVAGRG